MSKIELFVSVIIPIYNGEKDLPELIECLKNQTYNHEKTEFILVDNNSSDDTFKLIEEKAKILKKHQY